jgi:hypothetical protein
MIDVDVDTYTSLYQNDPRENMIVIGTTTVPVFFRIEVRRAHHLLSRHVSNDLGRDQTPLTVVGETRTTVRFSIRILAQHNSYTFARFTETLMKLSLLWTGFLEPIWVRLTSLDARLTCMCTRSPVTLSFSCTHRAHLVAPGSDYRFVTLDYL